MALNKKDDFDDDSSGQDRGQRKRAHSSGMGGFCASTPRSQKRDSGYLTDNSPASFSSQSLFSFDNLHVRGREDSARGAVGGSESDAAEGFSEGFSPIDDILLEGSNEDDDSAFVDNNSELLRESPFSPALDEPEFPEDSSSALQICRPRSNAFRHVDPAPPLLGATLRCSMPIPVRMPFGHRIPPFLSRTIATQTPHEHCQLIRQCLGSPLFLPVRARGTAHQRLRHYSEGESPQEARSDHGPLPDIIPMPRDRSVSLPDVRQQREVEVGRELRRLSDEFHFTYHVRRSRGRLHTVAENFEGEAASFPGARPAYLALWNSFRNLFSGSMEARLDTEDPSGPS